MTSGEFPNIAVMGAGAVGSYFGAKLARAGATVTLIGRPAFVEAVNRDGLRFESGGRVETVRAAATADASGVRGAGIVLLCVKSGDTETAAQAIAPHLDNSAVVLSLQNGVGNAERIAAHVPCPVVPALVYTAAQMPAPGHVVHTGGGSLVIGGTGRELLDEILAVFKAADVPVTVSADIDAELWTKLLMNCAYNAVSALCMANYATITAMPEIRAIMRAAADEVVAVAAAKTIRIPESVLEHMFDMGRTMPTQISSTAQDIAKGRTTEIDYLNGAVVREGERLGIATPVNRVLHALVKLKEKQ